MSLKYCYKTEIHKSFCPPKSFQALLLKINNLFKNKLPQNFSLQYKDYDGDLITISSDQEYLSMLRFDTLTSKSSLKILIVPSQISPERSFEVIEGAKDDKEGGLSEISLGLSEGKPSNEESPVIREEDATYSNRTPSNSFQGTNPFDDRNLREQGSSYLSNLAQSVSETLPQLYRARDSIVKDLVMSTPGRNYGGAETQEGESDNSLDITLERLLKEQSVDMDMGEFPEREDYNYNFENSFLSNEGNQKISTDINKRKALKEISAEIDRFEQQLANMKEAKSKQLDKPVSKGKVFLDKGEMKPFGSRDPSWKLQKYDSKENDKKLDEIDTKNHYIRSVFMNTDHCIETEDVSEINEENSQDYLNELFKFFENSQQKSICSKQGSWIDYRTGCNFQMPARVEPESPESAGIRKVYALMKKAEIRQIKEYDYQVMVGKSSSLRLIETEEAEIEGIAYKTIYIKNTGLKPWNKCYIRSIGHVAGNTVELRNIDVGETKIVTLEHVGQFCFGAHVSKWKVVHENKNKVLEVVGQSFDVRFTLEPNDVINDEIRNDKLRKYFPEYGYDYGRSLPSLENWSRKDSEEYKNNDNSDYDNEFINQYKDQMLLKNFNYHFL